MMKKRIIFPQVTKVTLGTAYAIVGSFGSDCVLEHSSILHRTYNNEGALNEGRN
jgi:hypothetical protein